MTWKSGQWCDLCKHEIYGDYWDAVRQDGKKVCVCRSCVKTAMTQVDPEDAPPFPKYLWEGNDNQAGVKGIWYTC